MADQDDFVYVGHMLDMTRRASKALQNKSRADYGADDILRLGKQHVKSHQNFNNLIQKYRGDKLLECGIVLSMIICVWMKMCYGK